MCWNRMISVILQSNLNNQLLWYNFDWFQKQKSKQNCTDQMWNWCEQTSIKSSYDLKWNNIDFTKIKF